MTEKTEIPRVIVDVHKAIREDSWMNIVCWGKPRFGKTTVQMKIAFSWYHDYDLVLQSFVYDLAGILYNIDHGIPTRFPTDNGLHNRVPILMPDDLGAGLNKAKTQYDPAMDIFKGAIDTYATKIAVFLSSMGTPNSITEQLQSKYTHEIYVDKRGHAKYDEVDWQQNFSGWQPRQKKAWQDEFSFDPVPFDVYREYDEHRLELVDLLNQQIKDAMLDNNAARVINRMEPIEKNLLGIINEKGRLNRGFFNDKENQKFREAMKKCKSRSLVVTIGNYYDLTDFGCEVLKIINNMDATPGKSEQIPPSRDAQKV